MEQCTCTSTPDVIYINFVVYRVPATGSPIPNDRVLAGAMIGWHVVCLCHWAAGDGEPPSAAHYNQNGINV